MTEITNEHILAKLDGIIIPSINVIKTEIAVINTKLDKIQVLENKTDKLFALTLGDGTESNKGICREVDALKLWKDDNKDIGQDVKELKIWRDARVWLERIVAIAVVGEIIGLAFLMVRLVFLHE
jgi:hypothetical protein